jgi:hypothetical protein
MGLNNAAGFLRHNQIAVMLALSALVLVLLVLVVYLAVRVRRLARMDSRAVDGETGRALKEELNACKKDLSALSDRLENVHGEHKNLEAQAQLCVQKVGFVRFDAFDDIGGEQSFTMALLDANNNGVVLSNVLSRVDSRVYAKRITGGTSEHTLSTEEQEAVRKASP